MPLSPVAKHLLDRRNKKVPTNDGRKIALVLLGGMMSGIRSAGAVMALAELGLANAFDDIYATSAGFPNASYLLTDNIKLGTSIYYEDLCCKEFINLKRLWNMVDIEYALNIINVIKPLDYKELSESNSRLHVKLLNTTSDVSEYHLVNGKSASELQKIMRAAMSVPYLNPGSVDIDGTSYKDAGRIKEKWISEVENALNSDATDIVVIYNLYEQYIGVKNAGIMESDRLLQIVPSSGPEYVLPICIDPERLKDEARIMGSIMKSELGLTGEITLI